MAHRTEGWRSHTYWGGATRDDFTIFTVSLHGLYIYIYSISKYSQCNANVKAVSADFHEITNPALPLDPAPRPQRAARRKSDAGRHMNRNKATSYVAPTSYGPSPSRSGCGPPGLPFAPPRKAAHSPKKFHTQMQQSVPTETTCLPSGLKCASET